MCGIVFVRSNEPCDHKEDVRYALTTLALRGPDSVGEWYSEDNKIAIGHSRLAINGDVNAEQPMLGCGDNPLVIAANGEIYNKRSSLEQQGAHFNSASDSEVLLHQFHLKGIAGLNELDGEFAFCVFDRKTQVAYLGRDASGIKPLFYAKLAGKVVAASDIKSLLVLGVSPKWNKAYLSGAEYFIQDAFQTFVDGVYSVPPGAVVKVSSKGIETISYIKKSPLNPSLFEPTMLSYRDACQQFETLLTTAIDKRLVKKSQQNNNNNSYLSSGIDSSIITAIASKLCDSFHAYTIAFESKGLDESKQASQFAQRLGISHDIVKVDDVVLADNFYDAVKQSEMPVPNINVAAKFHLSNVLKKAGQKIVLTGEGADESLLGYGFFKQDLSAPYTDIQQFPASWQHHLKAVQKQFGCLPAQAVHATPIGVLLSSLRTVAFQLQPSFNGLLNFSAEVRNTIELSQQLHYQTVFQSYNLGALADRTEMANGIEGRPPFLDKKLVEFIHSLPLSYKFNDGIDKRILREVALKYMPHNYAKMAKKPFLGAPASLKRQGPLAALFQSYFSTLTYLPEFYDKPKVAQLYQQALIASPEQQAQLDPVFMFLCSVMMLQQAFSMSL
jgi:asparagine synthase (glutamine-hydrolysing)